MSIVNLFQFNVVTTPNPANPSKTNINVQTGPHGLFSGGIILDVTIGVDAITARSLQADNMPVPQSVSTKALIDTGCTVTSIDTSLVKALNLKIRGYGSTSTANGEANTTQHLVSINFPGTLLKSYLTSHVQAVNLGKSPFLVLIGRDLMASWCITYNGPSGFVSIAD